MPAALANLIPLILLIVVMYFLMIRPQKKKDKQIQDMRKALTVGDEIITIGGICGKIVKTKEDSFIIQVGAVPDETVLSTPLSPRLSCPARMAMPSIA